MNSMEVSLLDWIAAHPDKMPGSQRYCNVHCGLSIAAAQSYCVGACNAQQGRIISKVVDCNVAWTR